ncbi:MAG: cobalamin biosynthesis protein CobG [Rhodobacter sp.]|nr:cobalamin biosynthesis protein CobG [Rhodobacter sp.]MCA3511843.1 cobalamin biosynthesis protein CobG [Rhodobacter sp.]MCA3521101.1 cobalamin biosynthesis protein CobG [Rhodobacter sp.]MCA3522935.1 cobalamin biosynthesis protein CobG [Rhodobacter sp.]MCA3524952.1 cobalamin biosynthesis protein CobG [Rhodobacter sp.]
MTRRPAARGWCPGAYRPMASGDGLIVRVRPLLARLTADQALGLCAAACAHGSGLIDLTSRANLQLRGVGADSHQALTGDLWALGLLDADPALEGRRNILVDPCWQDGDDTQRIAAALVARLADLPPLPAKFGFAIDAGPAPVLGRAPADLRVERGVSGGLILRADGSDLGCATTANEAAGAILALARWFAETGGAEAGRMARHLADHAVPDAFRPAEPPAAPGTLPRPGDRLPGPVYGAAFGRIDAGALARLISGSGAGALRVTPARSFVLEGGTPVPAGDFITGPDDPLLRADACPGAPFCTSATVETRDLARRLAPLVRGSLHVSGCAKGCARAGAADVTLTGRDGAFDLVRGGTAWDAPTVAGLAPARLPDVLGAL